MILSKNIEINNIANKNFTTHYSLKHLLSLFIKRHLYFNQRKSKIIIDRANNRTHVNTDYLLQILEQKISVLANELIPWNNHPISRSHFDVTLFANHRARLQDYLEEIQKNFTHLRDAAYHRHVNQVHYLSDKIVMQITAIKQEVVIQSMQYANKSKNKIVTDLNSLLAKHQNYEKRLNLMIQFRKNLIKKQGTLSAKTKTKHELVALSGRLIRCREALIRIKCSINLHEERN